MLRRDVIALIGGAVATWPLVAHAQQKAMPVIGYLGSQSAEALAPILPAFRNGLKDAGYIEGRNVSIEFAWAEGQYDKLPALAESPGEPAGRRHRRVRRRGRLACGQGCNLDDPDCLRDRRRPDPIGLVDELRPPWG